MNKQGNAVILGIVWLLLSILLFSLAYDNYCYRRKIEAMNTKYYEIIAGLTDNDLRSIAVNATDIDMIDTTHTA